jgi:hypothetical protein
MTKLTKRQESFIAIMQQNDELALRGFGLLLQRPDFPNFFNSLQDAGLFAPHNNPGPVPGERENTIRIPFWAPLEYLKAVAEYASRRHDMERATQIINVIRDVSKWRDEANEPRRNYQTNRIFAQILGILPTSITSIHDIDLIEEWIKDPYERMLVSDAIDQGLLPRLLASESPDDWEKAARLLWHMTAIVWRSDTDGGEPKPITIVDDYWLQRVIDHHAKFIGERSGASAVRGMLERTKEVFSTPLRREHSTIFRPAIESHAQNHHWRSAENCTVDALRDVMLGWAQTSLSDAKRMLNAMLLDEFEIIRRIAIYVLGQNWSTMSDVYTAFAKPSFFNNGHSHELYHLLEDNFALMPAEQRDATVTAIKELPRPQFGDDPEIVRKHQQLRWLSAVKGKNDVVDEWLEQLESEEGISKLSAHPDFDSYITSWSGPGPSPYSTEELTGLARAHVIVDKLNSFQDVPSLDGPGVDGLKSALSGAARQSPQVFLDTLTQFHSVRLEYQHEIISGLRQAWEAKDSTVDWFRGWEQVISYFEQIVVDDSFWQQSTNEYQHLVVMAIADTLRGGTQSDDHAYEPDLLPRAQNIIDTLLQHEPPDTSPSDDAMFQALNTPKGRVVEALFSHALRAARVSDKIQGTHVNIWEDLQPIFERELSACKNANFEFSTLCGTYLSQLQYLDQSWTHKHVDQIFPADYESNMTCALDGLAYAAFTRVVYEVLTKHGILDHALTLPLNGRDARSKLLERIAAAYLWGMETIDGQRFDYIFKHATTGDIEAIAWVFWTVRGAGLTRDQRERIVAFWERAVRWTNEQPKTPEQTLSQLGTLAVHLTTIGERELVLLEAVAPYVGMGHNHYEFVKELVRLAPENHAKIVVVLEKMLSSHVPDYDYEDRLRHLLDVLASKGHRNAVMVHAEKLRHLPGIQELYNKLRTRH